MACPRDHVIGLVGGHAVAGAILTERSLVAGIGKWDGDSFSAAITRGSGRSACVL